MEAQNGISPIGPRPADNHSTGSSRSRVGKAWKSIKRPFANLKKRILPANDQNTIQNITAGRENIPGQSLKRTHRITPGSIRRLYPQELRTVAHGPKAWQAARKKLENKAERKEAPRTTCGGHTDSPKEADWVSRIVHRKTQIKKFQRHMKRCRERQLYLQWQMDIATKQVAKVNDKVQHCKINRPNQRRTTRLTERRRIFAKQTSAIHINNTALPIQTKETIRGYRTTKNNKSYTTASALTVIYATDNVRSNSSTMTESDVAPKDSIYSLLDDIQADGAETDMSQSSSQADVSCRAVDESSASENSINCDENQTVRCSNERQEITLNATSAKFWFAASYTLLAYILYHCINIPPALCLVFLNLMKFVILNVMVIGNKFWQMLYHTTRTVRAWITNDLTGNMNTKNKQKQITIGILKNKLTKLVAATEDEYAQAKVQDLTQLLDILDQL